MLEMFNVPSSMLLTIEQTCGVVAGVPIGAILGDQHSATFGQTCFNVGDAKSTFGTGAFIMMNMRAVDPKAAASIVSKQRLLTAPFRQIEGQPAVYALERAVAVAGTLLKRLRDNLELGTWTFR
jgi:glycerol kinase